MSVIFTIVAAGIVSAITAFIAAALANLFNALVKGLSVIAQFLADVLMAILGFLLGLVADFLSWVISLLPDVPDLPEMGNLPQFIAAANYFLPLDTVVKCLGFIAATYAAVWAYKLAKFLRGGG